MEIQWPQNLDEAIAWLREYSVEELMDLGFNVRGTFDEVDDPELLGPGGLVADSWREGHPYDERLSQGEYEGTKRLLQIELLKAQSWIKESGQRLVVIFEGRDAAGKGGTIKRFTEHLDPRGMRTVALSAPSEREQGQWYFQRYLNHLPTRGEITLFDRSWYNRGVVEPVMGFCTKAQYRRFMSKVVGYEERIIGDQKTSLIKLYFSVSKDEQERRFERRRNDPLRQWKLSEVDLQAQELWDDFTKTKYKLLKKTHTAATPWFVIRSDDKALARLETIKLILRQIKYSGRSRTLDFEPNPDIVIRGDRELKIMQKQKRKHGKFIR